MTQHEDAGLVSRILTQFPTRPVLSDEVMLENVRSSVARKLPLPAHCKPHDRIMSVAGGGPSLGETWRDLTGVIVTANAGLGFLLEHGIKPWACGLLDARPHIADLIEPWPDIFYFAASICHPRVFDKLKGCNVVLWHPSGMPGLVQAIPHGTPMIRGGCTMGLRWITLGYYMGFRRFECHGFDSSYRGTQTHAYPDVRDGHPPEIVVDGRATALNFLQQIEDFKAMRADMAECDEPPIINLHGDGLLQSLCSTSSA